MSLIMRSYGMTIVAVSFTISLSRQTGNYDKGVGKRLRELGVENDPALLIEHGIGYICIVMLHV